MLKKKLLNINKKKTLKILLTFILIILLLLFAFAKVYAEDEDEDEIKNSPEFGEIIGKFFGGLLNGLLGILLWDKQIIAAACVIVIYLIVCILFFLIGNTSFFVTPADIFYNRIPILSIDFFDFSTSDSGAFQIRTEVAKWFVTLSSLSVIFLLIVLIYIAIRAVLANTGESKAKYQKMFVNWLISLGLLAGLGIIIVGSITLNNVLVGIIEKASLAVSDGKDITFIIIELIAGTMRPLNFIGSAASIILLAILVLQTFKYATVYIKRMIKIAFLIMIAPLVTITYSIDKIGDDKSQALNTWMHIFIFNVFIQSFHALIFSVFFLLSFGLTSELKSSWNFFGTFTNNIPTTILAIMSLRFIGEAEEIIRKIFKINDGEKLQDGSKLASFALAGKAIDITKGMIDRARVKQGKDRIFESSMKSDSDAKKQIASAASSTTPKGGGSPVKGDDSATIPEDSDSPAVSDAKKKFDDEITNIIDDKEGKHLYKSSLSDKIDKLPKPLNHILKAVYNSNRRNTFKGAGTILGAVFGIAGGDLAAAWGLVTSGNQIGKYMDERKEHKKRIEAQRGKLTKRELYVENTREAAKEAMRTHDMNKLINGEVPELDTKKQIEGIQSWFRMINDKANTGQLLEEYRSKRQDLIRKLQQMRGITEGRATAITYQLENMLTSGRLPEEGTPAKDAFDTLEGKEFSNSVLEYKQYQDIKSYNNLESDIRNVSYDYDNVENVLKDEEIVEYLKENLEEPPRMAPPISPKMPSPTPSIDGSSDEKEDKKTRKEKRAEKAKETTGDATDIDIKTGKPKDKEPETIEDFEELQNSLIIENENLRKLIEKNESEMASLKNISEKVNRLGDKAEIDELERKIEKLQDILKEFKTNHDNNIAEINDLSDKIKKMKKLELEEDKPTSTIDDKSATSSDTSDNRSDSGTSHTTTEDKVDTDGDTGSTDDTSID